MERFGTAGHRRIWLRALAAIALAVSIGTAQTKVKTEAPTPPPEPGILHGVKVEGNHLYPEADIVKVLGLTIGGPVAPADFDVAKQKLINTELFANIGYEFSYFGKPQQYDLVMKVVEYDQVFPMRFEELGIPDEQVRQYLREHVLMYADRIPGSEAVLKRYRDVIQELVAQKDPALKIRARVVADDPNQLVALFRPNTPPPMIARVTVLGNKEVETQAIQKAINEVAVGTPYTDTSLKMILDHAVKGLYDEQGYVNVTFTKIEAVKAQKINGYDVTVTIHEGPKYTFGPIAFRGGDLGEDDVKAMLKFKVGEVFNGTQAEDLRIALISAMKRKGHLLAAGDIERKVDDEKHTVNLRYLLDPGPTYTFATLEIHGLDIESEPVIRKMWAEQPGKPFNPDYPEYFLKKVEQAQLFDNLGDTRSDFTPNETTHGVKVDLFFKGSGPGDKKKEKRRERDGQSQL
jgi:outer membrane protein insertion porin family